MGVKHRRRCKVLLKPRAGFKSLHPYECDTCLREWCDSRRDGAWTCNSVWPECHLDTVVVVGSNPAMSTKLSSPRFDSRSGPSGLVV
jgi:hypothetical protein